MAWLLVALAAILASEAMLRLPLLAQARSVIDVSGRSVRTLRSKRISDHWKERVLPAYSLRMAKGSVGFFLCLLAALAPVALLGLVAPGGFPAWIEFLLRPAVMVLLCAVSVGYIWVRVRMARG